MVGKPKCDVKQVKSDVWNGDDTEMQTDVLMCMNNFRRGVFGPHIRSNESSLPEGRKCATTI